MRSSEMVSNKSNNAFLLRKTTSCLRAGTCWTIDKGVKPFEFSALISPPLEISNRMMFEVTSVWEGVKRIGQ